MSTEERQLEDGAAAGQQVIPPPPPPPHLQGLPVPATQQPYSNAQPVWQFILLNLCTFTLYEIVWFYRNWHVLKAQRDLRVTPLVRAIFAPLFSWRFFAELEGLAGRGYIWPLPPSTLATCYFLLTLTGRLLERLDNTSDEVTGLTLLAVVIGLSTTFTLLPAVRALNEFWASEQPGQPLRTSLSGGAIAVIIIGGLFLLIMLVVALGNIIWGLSL